MHQLHTKVRLRIQVIQQWLVSFNYYFIYIFNYICLSPDCVCKRIIYDLVILNMIQLSIHPSNRRQSFLIFVVYSLTSFKKSTNSKMLYLIYRIGLLLSLHHNSFQRIKKINSFCRATNFLFVAINALSVHLVKEQKS